MSVKVHNERWRRWVTCSMCEQDYHGVVRCALGWACWKTYLGRPETDEVRQNAMNQLGLGLSGAEHHADALSVNEAQLSMGRRLGYAEYKLLIVQGNLADTYKALGRLEEALQLKRDVYYGNLRLNGNEHYDTIREAFNYAKSLAGLQRFEEAKSLLRKTIPVARRVLGEGALITLSMRGIYGQSLYGDNGATLDDLREAVATLEEIARISRRVLGNSHPVTGGIEGSLKRSRSTLRARETQSRSA